MLFEVTLTQLWVADIKNAIPRGITFFGDTRQFVLINGLETGEMYAWIPLSIALSDFPPRCCRDSQNANILWTKNLASAMSAASCFNFFFAGWLINRCFLSGDAVLSPDKSTLIVDNMWTGGFDVYRFPASSPSSSLAVTSVKRFTKQCVFSDDAKVAICGGSIGMVHAVDVSSGESIQSLRCGEGTF